MKRCFLEDILSLVESITSVGLVDANVSSIDKEGIEYELLRELYELSVYGTEPSFIQHVAEVRVQKALRNENLDDETLERLIYLKNNYDFMMNPRIEFKYNFMYQLYDYVNTKSFDNSFRMKDYDLDERVNKIKFAVPDKYTEIETVYEMFDDIEDK